MINWELLTKPMLRHKAVTPFGNLIVQRNSRMKKRIDTGHKHKQKRWKSIKGQFVNAPSQADGYKDTIGYKYIGSCNVNNNRKEFFGNNVEMVKKLVENHYRQILRQAVKESSRV